MRPGVQLDEMGKDASIYVAGADTLVGAALVRRLAHHGYRRVVNRERPEPNLRDRAAVDAFFSAARPAYVVVAAGKSGGIQANTTRPAELMLDNLMLAGHLIDAAHRHGVTKLLYVASSCVYPREAAAPMSVGSILTGPLESTSEAYALAKLAGIKLCQAYRRQHGADFISGIAADVFGPGDDFGADDSHVLGALMRRIHEAKVQGRPTVDVWGTGKPIREFIFSDDLADACIVAMRAYSGAAPINLAGGAALSIRELAESIMRVVGYTGDLRFDTSRPDGMPNKSLDSTVIRGLGWRPATPFDDGLTQTYNWFLRARHKQETQETRAR